MHIANLPHWASITLERTEFDTNPPDGPRVTTPGYESGAKLLQTYDANVIAARALLARTTDAEFMVQWALKNGGKSMFSMPRIAVFRVVRPEPRRASSWTVERVPATARRVDPEYLRADRRYIRPETPASPPRRGDAEIRPFEKRNSLRPCVSAVRLAFCEDAADHKRDVGRPFAQSAHEIRKPLPAERHVDAHAITG